MPMFFGQQDSQIRPKQACSASFPSRLVRNSLLMAGDLVLVRQRSVQSGGDFWPTEETGRDGIEYPSAVGPIDILAVDDEGAFFVFELKRANSPDRALGQVARYMGWVKQTIGKGKNVYGVIVAKAISENLKFARTVVPDVYLFEYQVSFTLNQAHELSIGRF